MKSLVLLASLLPTLAFADPAIRPALGGRFLSGDLACGALAIYADDVNHDGRKDVIYVTNGRCDLVFQIHTALGQPDGSFVESAVSDLPTFNTYPHCGERLVDVDGDGNLDVTFMEAYLDQGTKYSVVVAPGNGAGAFGSERLLWADVNYVASAVFGEFTGDGRTDLAITRGDGSGLPHEQIVILSGTASGPFTLWQAMPVRTLGQQGVNLTAAQLDGDGRADLVWGPSNAIEVYRGKPGGGFDPPMSLPTGAQPQAVGVGDFNGDGLPDVAAWAGTGAWISFQHPGSFDGPVLTPTLGLADRFRVADLDGDGKDDLVYPATSGIVVQPVNGAGVAAARLIQSESRAVDWVPGDFDQAGKADLLLLGSASGLALHLDPWDASFSEAATTPGPAQPLAIDLDRDGNLDAVMTSPTTDQLTILWGDGTGKFSARTDLSTGDRPVAIAAAQLDGDAWPDLVVTADPAGTVSVRRGLGGRAFAAPVDYVVGGHPSGAAIGDLDGDGLPDVAVAQMATSRIQVLHGDGLGALGAPQLVSTGPEPVDPHIADLDRDGHADLVYGLRGASGIGVRFGQDGGVLGAEQLGPGAHRNSALSLLDDDHDGRLDVATLGDDSHVTLARTNPDQTFSGFGASDLPTVLGLASGDFDADGHDDLAYVRNGFNVSWVSAAVGILENMQPGLIVDEGPLFGAQLDGSAIAAGDFNHDLRPDILVVSAARSNATVLLNAGTSPLVGVAPPPLPSALHLRFASRMPARGSFALAFDAPTTDPVFLRVLSARGTVAYRHEIPTNAAGAQLARFTPTGLRGGVYWAEVRQGTLRDVVKFVFVP